MAMKTLLLRIVVHITPIVPFFYGRTILAVILLLLVALFYIKSFKLQVILEDYKQRGLRDADELEKMERHIQRWRYLTFLDYFRKETEPKIRQ